MVPPATVVGLADVTKKGIRRTFRLHEGKGTMRIHLDKPPGNVDRSCT
jgi:hypothetical protein